MNFKEVLFDCFNDGELKISHRHTKNFDADFWHTMLGKIHRWNNEDLKCCCKLIRCALYNKMDSIYSKKDFDRFSGRTYFATVILMMVSFKHCMKNVGKIDFYSKNDYKQIEQFIAEHFFKYNVPKSFYNFFYSTRNHFDFEKILKIADGVSPRKVYGISKNENKYFWDDVDIENERMFLAYLSSRACGCNKELAYHLSYELSRKITDKLVDELDYQIFLMKCRHFATWFANQDFFDYNVIVDILDYIKFNYVFMENCNLSGRNINSMIKRVEEWHVNLNRERRFQDNHWEKRGFDDNTNDKYEFIELNTSKLLKQEGSHQHNCVYSYLKRCFLGDCAIVSMRKLSTDERTTIEISLAGKSIKQIKEKYNKVVPVHKFDIIKEYANRKGLRCNKRDLC